MHGLVRFIKHIGKNCYLKNQIESSNNRKVVNLNNCERSVRAINY